MDIFLTLICCKKGIFCLKRPKINEKEAAVGPFKRTKRIEAKMIPNSCPGRDTRDKTCLSPVYFLLWAYGQLMWFRLVGFLEAVCVASPHKRFCLELTAFNKEKSDCVSFQKIFLILSGFFPSKYARSWKDLKKCLLKWKKASAQRKHEIM